MTFANVPFRCAARRLSLIVLLMLATVATAPAAHAQYVEKQADEAEPAINRTFVSDLDFSAAQAAVVSFSSSGLTGANISNPTSLEFGPDGRL